MILKCIMTFYSKKSSMLNSFFTCILILEGFFLASIYLYSAGVGPFDIDTKEADKIISPKSKSFAYYVVTDICLPAYLLSDFALGNSSICDVYVLSFKQHCKVSVPDDHITYYYHPDTTWTTARNLLYKYSIDTQKHYLYHTFIDDDVKLFYTSYLHEFAERKKLEQFNRKVEFMEMFLKSEDGLEKAALTWKKSPWRRFEDLVLEKSPAFAQVNLCEDNGNQIRTFQIDKWHMICPHDTQMPDITPVFFIDTLFISYHAQAAPLLLPYSTILDDTSWFASAMYQMFRLKALFYRQGIAIWSLSVANPTHGQYPRSQPPSDYLERYFNADGKDIKELFDPRETDFVVFYDHGKWKHVFLGDRGVCSDPVKFPVQDHYSVL